MIFRDLFFWNALDLWMAIQIGFEAIGQPFRLCLGITLPTVFEANHESFRDIESRLLVTEKKNRHYRS